jgi:hypothetical protein
MSWMDGLAPSMAATWYAARRAQERQEQVRARERALEQARAVRAATMRACVPRILTGDVDAMYRFFLRLCEHHRIRVVWKAKPAGGGSAAARARRITVMPITNLTTFAGALHEVGHVVNGPCPEQWPHQRIIEGRFGACLECERAAWATAMDLVPFADPAMHADVVYCLGTYLTTRAPAQVKVGAQRLIGTVTLRSQQHRWFLCQERLERQARVNASVARDAQQRQRWADMWARQARANRRTA